MKPLLLLLSAYSLCSVGHLIAATKPKTPAPSIADLAESLRPSLVKITQLGREGTDGIGSGFIVREDGLIATNLHVIGEARRLQVEMHDGKKHEVTAIHASDNHLDLALLKIDAKGLKALPLGDSSKVRQGIAIVAMGAPEGLAFSIVQGILSATQDDLPELEGIDMLQLALPVEKGNSGGPVLDLQGRVLGVVTLKSAKTDNLGFAMPVNELKPLIDKPNPVPMSRWLTIGVLNPKIWTPHFGGQWTQHAGVIKSEMIGAGIGGRTLCISSQKVPADTFEVAVNVRLEEESGAAGLMFSSDGGYVHYGFYPTNGRLRLTRFEGPDVYSWTVLADVASDAYKPEDWNHLRVRVTAENITCFLNGKQVIQSDDTGLRSGFAGLCRFRSPAAEYRNFRIGADLAEKPLDAELASRLRSEVEAFIGKDSTSNQTLKNLLAEPAAARRIITEERLILEQNTAKLRELERDLHRRAMTHEILAELDKPEPEINLLRCSLLLARHDNSEIDINTPLTTFKDMVADLKDDPEIQKGTIPAVKRLNRYLFEENGFHGSRHDLNNRSNSYMNELLDDREGLPITLSVLYIELAAKLHISGVFGVGLPGKFMVGYRDGPEGDLQLIDVFERGTPLTVEQAALSMTSDGNIPEDYLQPTTKKAIIERMVRNLFNFTKDQDDLVTRESLPYLDLFLAIDPKSSEHRFLRANLRTSLGQKAAAHDDVTHLIDTLPDNAPPTFLPMLEQWRRSLRDN